MDADNRAPFVTTGSRTVYENPWVRVTEDDIVRPDGTHAAYAVVHASDFAVVIPFDGHRYTLVEQYRHPIGARRWEFPQGTVHGPQPVDPQRIAERELAEETGLVAKRYDRLGYLHEGYGRSTTGFTVYLATGLVPGPPQREAEEQDMRTGTFTHEQLWAMVDAGVVTDASTVAALALLERWQARR